MTGRPYDHERDGITGMAPAEAAALFDVPEWLVDEYAPRPRGLEPSLVLVDEAAAWQPEPWQEELLERWETERPYVIVTDGGRRDGVLERAWWWLT